MKTETESQNISIRKWITMLIVTFSLNKSESEAHDIFIYKLITVVLAIICILISLVCIWYIIDFDTVCREDDNVYVKCEVLDDNQPAMWYKDETKLSTSDKYEVETHEKFHRRVMYHAKPEDQGEYSVTIESCVQRSDLTVQEYFTKSLCSHACIEGDNVYFECEVLDDNQTAMWLKDGAKLSTSDKYKVETHGKLQRLVVYNAKPDDQGKYSVTIKSCTQRSDLTVLEYFTKTLDYQVCIEGDYVHFECEVIDDNQTARWYKDGIEVSTSDKYKVERHGKCHRLIVNYTILNDQGEYSVMINNVVRLSYLIVQEYFTMTLDSKACVEGESVYFECEVLDDYHTARWFKDGAEIRMSNKYKLERREKFHRLVVNNAKIDDQGEYSVMIKNCARRSLLTVREIPAAIHHMSERDKDLYREIIRTETETRYFIRISIIGEKGVGKTCLLRRLLGETIEDVESTDGIDVVRRCKIRLRDGRWVVDKDTYKRKEIISRLKIAFGAHVNKDALNELIEDKLKYVPQLYKKDITMPSAFSTGYIRKGDGDTLFLQENELSFGELNTVQETKTESRLDKVLSETILNDLSQLINDIEKYDMPLEVMVDCGIWDFGGQSQYYTTHSVFLNPNTIHLLVVDIMKDVKQINADVGYDNIGEYIDFWFDSIHSCRVVEDTNNSTSDNMNPPVILVCAGIDKCKDKLDERKNEFCKQLQVVLHNEDKQKHLRSICCISNTEPSDKDFDDLRHSIFEFGKNIETFAVKLPLRWIRLERALDIVNEAGVAILSWHDMIDLASKCLIADENEVSLFLKYHHNIGSIIYFESLKEHIILNQKWLTDAFRCLISDKYDDNLKLTHEWKTLKQTGELKPSLIIKLFKKEPERQFYQYKSFLLGVMEKFGIIVKLTTITKDSQNKTVSTYYMPCKISRTTSIKQIYDAFSVKRATCAQTPWLCIQFDFLPFDFFNQIFCHYIKKYDVCTEAKSGQVALYHGMGVFFHDNNKSIKFILCFSKNTIGMQIWQWRKLEHGRYKSMLDELRSVIHNVKDNHEPRSVSYTIKAKCAYGDIHITAGRYSFQELKDLGHEEYFCKDHNEMHDVKDLFQTWFEEYSENEDNIPALQTFKEIPDTKFLQRCTVCDKEPSVYWCHECQISMCKDCYNQHMGSDYAVHRNAQHVYDKFTRTYNFQAIAREIRDIKVLNDGLLVMVDRKIKQLVTCHITGQEQQTIPLPGLPLCITIVDNKAVAVTLYSKVGIVDVRQRQVIRTIDVNVWCYGITYRESQLFVGCDDRTIKIMDMSGDVKRTIPVGVIPKYICGDESSLLYYTDCVKLYCIDTKVNSLFTFHNDNINGLAGMTTGNKGQILVTSTRSNSVLEISLDGKKRHVILRQIPSSSNRHPFICYDSRSELLVIGLQNTVYVYKKV